MGAVVSTTEKSTQSGFVVSVLSGNGGVGKSTVAACLAVLFQEKGLKTVLVDLDLQFGDAGFLLGLDDVVGIDELVRQPERINQVKPSGGLPAVVGIPEKLEESEAFVSYTSEVLSLLKSRFDAVVVNTGSFGLTAISRCLRPQTRFYSFLISGPRRCALVRAPLISALVAALRSSHSDSFLTSVRNMRY